MEESMSVVLEKQKYVTREDLFFQTITILIPRSKSEITPFQG